MPTTNLSLTLPTENGSKGSWGTELNTALTAIDAVLKDATTSVHGFISTTDKSKLDNIEAAAKDDQTAAEIKTLYESVSETRASGVSAGTYGTSTDTPQFIVNANGRITSATNVAIDNVNIAEGVAVSLSIALG